MTYRVKLCGLRRMQDVEAALHAGADDLGFVFYAGSKRYVSTEDAPLLRAIIPAQRRAIAVVVDADDETLDVITSRFQPDMFQLHGNEAPERIAAVKIRTGRPVIKAIAVHARIDIETAQIYNGVADALLFDTKARDGTSGGTGESFDWRMMDNLTTTLPWYLSGGLGPDNVADALRISGAKWVDASSRLESAPGEKDPALLAGFVAAVKRYADG